MKIIVRGCLIAQMKRQGTLIATQKPSFLCDVPLLKKLRKTSKNCNFFKNYHFWGIFLNFSATVHCKEQRFFLCNQCVQALHLSYQTLSYNDFHFSAYNVFFFKFLDPWYGGKNINFEKNLKQNLFQYIKLHMKMPGVG